MFTLSLRSSANDQIPSTNNQNVQGVGRVDYWKLVLGISLCVLCSSFAVTPQAFAAPGLTNYTRRVIERARSANLGEGKSESWQPSDVWHWLQYGMSDIFSTRDSDVTRTAEQQRLPGMTACQYADVMLILHEMEKTRGEIKTARDRTDSVAVRQLGNVYDFLNQRLKVLEGGGTRPGYVDQEWNTPLSFDTKDTADGIVDEKLCPFSTLYMETGLEGSPGCSVDDISTALSQLQSEFGGDMDKGVEATQAEQEALQKLLDKLNEVRLPGETPPPAPEQVEGCIEEWPPSLRTWSAGHFLAAPGARFLTMVRLLLHLELLRVSPFQPQSPFTWNLGLSVFNPELARDFQEFNTQQVKGNALIRIGIVESQGIDEAFSPLTQAIGTFSRLVQDIHPDQGDKKSDDRSLRDMVRDATFFLRRSCMNRDCNPTLERVMNIISADDCFPYTRGVADLPDDATQDERDQKIKDLKQKCSAQSGVPQDQL